MKSSIYQPAEDSYFLSSVLSSICKNKSVLDMGSGSGILAQTALKNKASNVLAIDINPEAIKFLKSRSIPSLKSNLFSTLPKKEKFDIIVFNPPYLPQDKRESKESQLVTTGGKQGDEIILRFLKQAPNHLNKTGFILLLTSSLTPLKRIDSLLAKLNLKKTLLSSRKIFMESLHVWKIC